MPRVEIPLYGQSSKDSIGPIANQRTVNLIPHINISSKKSLSLEGSPGAVSFSDGQTDGRGQGVFVSGGSVYSVVNSVLYKIASDGAVTNLGALLGYTTEQAIFAQGDNRFHIVFSNRVYKVVSDIITEITDAQLESPKSVVWLNGYFLYDGGDGRFWVSELDNPDQIDPLDFATAERRPDAILRMYVYANQVWMFGETSIEIWYPSGSTTPPFSPLTNVLYDVGIIGTNAVSSTYKSMFFIGNDREPYVTQGLAIASISTPALMNEWNSYAVVSDAICFCSKHSGRDVLTVRFPSQYKTWQYFADVNAWVELNIGGNEADYPVSNHVFAYQRNLIQNINTGQIYELSNDVFDFAGTPFVTQRDTDYIRSDDFGQARVRLFYNKVELVMEPGVGLLSGQGSNPEVMMSYSDDYGKTWSSERRGNIGALGQFDNRITWNILGSAYTRQFRFKVSDPVKRSLVALYVDGEIGRN